MQILLHNQKDDHHLVGRKSARNFRLTPNDFLYIRIMCNERTHDKQNHLNQIKQKTIILISYKNNNLTNRKVNKINQNNKQYYVHTVVPTPVFITKQQQKT